MATFWGSAERGFDRGVTLGADLYQRALDNAARARAEAHRERQAKVAEKHQQRMFELNKEMQERRMAESLVREARQKFEMQLTKDAQAAKKAGDESPVPASIRQAAQETYGVALPADATMGSLGALGIDPEKMMQERGRQRTAAIPRQSVHTTNAGGGSPIRGGRLAALEDLDAQIYRLEGELGAVNPEATQQRKPIQQQIDQLRAEHRRAMSGLNPAEYDAYEARPRTVDASETILPGLTPAGGSNRLQQALDAARAAQAGASPASAPLPARDVSQPAQAEPAEDYGGDEWDFLDDLDF